MQLQRQLMVVLLGVMLLFGCQAGTPPGGPKFYDWPTAPFDKTHQILSTFGEFRANAPDITKLHSGTDLPEHGDAVQVFSPDVGVVTRDTHDPSNPSKGSGAIRVGHFGFNHPQAVFPKVDTWYESVHFPPDLPIHVVNVGATVYAPKNANPDVTKDADFKAGPMPKQVAIGYVKKGGKYEKVSLWPRSRAIAGNVQPTDLHVIYYDTADGDYRDTQVANALEVLRNYKNAKDPEANMLWLYTHATDEARLTFDKVNNSTVLVDTDKGAKLKTRAFSTFVNTCGVYHLDYEIACSDPPKTTGRRKVWKFHTLPSDADSFVLVDEKLSNWTNVNNPKFTVYVLTSSDNGTVNKDNHWELEDTTKWPDCRYTITVWIKNIKEAKGEGQEPDVNEVTYTAEGEVKTLSTSPLKRSVTVTKKFAKK